MSTRTRRPLRRIPAVGVAALAAVAALSACSSADAQPPAEPFTLSSPDLDADGRLPDWATNTAGSFCAGENRSPELEWSGAPEGTQSFALTMTDPANPTYIHWVVTAIPADVTEVPSAPAGDIGIGVTGASWRGSGVYAGVCLEDNPYVYTVYALDEAIEGTASTTHDALLELIDGHVIDSAELEVLRAEDVSDTE